MSAASPVAGPPFKFMTWNIYAHTHTNWAKFAHDCANYESRMQMIQRHTLIIKAICQEFPDIIALQEVDTFFMSHTWDPLKEPLPCGQRLTHYLPFQDYAYAKAPEGTAILLRRGVFELDPDAPHPKDASVYGCTDTGGKSATVLWARRVGVPNSTIAVVSVHLKGCPPGEWKEGHMERRFLLKAICRSLHRYPAPVVLAGDFNVRSGEFLDRICKLMYKELGMLKVSSPKNIPTSLMPDFRFDPLHRIDYIFLSPELKAHGKPTMGLLPGDGPKYDDQGPFGVDKGNGSDHRWLMCPITPHVYTKPYKYPDTATTAPDAPTSSNATIGNSFTLMFWNVLSTGRTCQFQMAHQQPDIESDEQRITRQQTIFQVIKRESPEILLLQDIDETLIPTDWVPDQLLPCGELLPNYTLYRCKADGMGTAILVKKGVYEADPTTPTFEELSVLPSEETGGMSATVMWLRRIDAPRLRFGIASVQLKEYTGQQDDGTQNQRYQLLKAVAASLKKVPGPLIVAGDFGARRQSINWLAPTLGKELKMKLVEPKFDLPTALMPDLSYDPQHHIDHLFTTLSVTFVGPQRLGLLPGERGEYDNRGPYGNDPSDGSDHRWVMYTAEILWNRVMDVLPPEDADFHAAPPAKRAKTEGSVVPVDQGDD